MIIIKHRVNTIAKLKELDSNFGVEVDVRYHEDDLILSHDPFSHHLNHEITLKNYLENYQLNGPLILNVKTEGVESQCITLMNQFGIKNWFFLDLSMPYFVKYAQLAKAKSIEGFGPENLAVRFSEFEPIEYALAFKEMAKWVWVDYFTASPLGDDAYNKLASHFNICLVSPELQQHSKETINVYKNFLSGKVISAVCTKHEGLWRE